MKKILFLLLFSSWAYSQVGIGNTNPQGALDITSSSDGLLIPRVALTSTTVTTPVITITTSELVYNTNTAGTGNTAVSPGYYYWNGSAWKKLTTLGEDWSTKGNLGTSTTNDFLGTTDNVGVRIRTNNTLRMEVENDGQVYIGTASPYATDLFSSTGAANSFAINGYTSGGGWGVYGEAQNAIGVAGVASSGTGTGIAGTNGNYTLSTLTGGSGVAGSGNTTGVYGTVKNTTGTRQAGYFSCINTTASTANDPLALLAGQDTNAIYGGYFDSRENTSTYAYVGLRFGGTNYKILGGGSVSTIVKDNTNTKRILFAPESPEITFQDSGSGQLVNGKAIINLDPILSNNIFVDEKHPLKVFIQLEGDCNGVFVTNKSISSFTVKELQNGNSNVKFSWQIIANRSDSIDESGNIESKHVNVRFPIAPNQIIKVDDQILLKKE